MLLSQRGYSGPPTALELATQMMPSGISIMSLAALPCTRFAEDEIDTHGFAVTVHEMRRDTALTSSPWLSLSFKVGVGRTHHG